MHLGDKECDITGHACAKKTVVSRVMYMQLMYLYSLLYRHFRSTIATMIVLRIHVCTYAHKMYTQLQYILYITHVQ